MLEDLGIEPQKIGKKFLAILTQRGIKEVANYDDMTGPILVGVLFGLLLLFKGKIEFGNIYGFGLTGCVGIYLLINLLTKKNQYVELYTTISILGYSLMPFLFLASGSLFLDVRNFIGFFICVLIVGWSTVTATRFFHHGMDM